MGLRETNLVSRKTAEDIARLLRQGPGPLAVPSPARGGARGRMPVIVRCESATPAGGGGIGDEAYDATMIAAYGTVTAGDQPDQSSVWLTVLGEERAAEVPTEGHLYHGIFAGEFDPDPGGAGTDRRPRVFAVAPVASSSGSCSSNCGSLGRLADDACLRLELVCASGSFGAIDAEQFAGVYAFGAAGVWTFEKWDGDSWEPVTIDYLGGTGGAVFTWNGTPLPTLTLDGVELTLQCLGSDATFAAHPRNGITGDPEWAPADDCDDNELVFRVSCSCCPPDGYTGPGYYPVTDTTCDECVGAELTDETVCDFTGTVCGQKFATLEEAEAFCAPGTFPTCDTLPASLDYTVTSDGCLNGLVSVMNEYTGGSCGPTERCYDDGNLVTPCSTDSGLAYICDTLTETRSAVYNGITLTFVSETASTITYSYPGPFGSPITGTFATFVISIP